MTKENEKILIDRCKQGEISAFEELITGYEKRVFNIVYRIIGNYDEAQDISQEIFLKVFKSIKSFKEKSSFYTWLYSIAVNECRDLIRKKKKVVIYSIDVPIETNNDEITREIIDDCESIEDKIERKELRGCIEAALKTVSYDHQVMIILRDVQGMSYEEIGQILKCPPGTVKSRINRARNALKEILINKKELFLKNKV